MTQHTQALKSARRKAAKLNPAGQLETARRTLADYVAQLQANKLPPVGDLQRAMHDLMLNDDFLEKRYDLFKVLDRAYLQCQETRSILYGGSYVGWTWQEKMRQAVSYLTSAIGNLNKAITMMRGGKKAVKALPSHVRVYRVTVFNKHQYHLPNRGIDGTMEFFDKGKAERFYRAHHGNPARPDKYAVLREATIPLTKDLIERLKEFGNWPLPGVTE